MKQITLPTQQENYPNTNDIFIDGVWIQACITCGKEGGDCEHTMIPRCPGCGEPLNFDDECPYQCEEED